LGGNTIGFKYLNHRIMVRSLLFFSLLYIFSCGNCKDKNCPDSLFYQVPYTLTPATDTFNLGDTIWIEMDFPEEMTDVNGGVKNIFHNYDFRIELGCERIDVNPGQPKTVDFLHFHEVIGRDSLVNLPGSSISTYRIFPVIQDGKYHFKCGLITQKKGFFIFGITPIEYSEYEEKFHINGSCDNIPLGIGSKPIGAEGNFHMLQYSLEPAYPNFPKDRFENYGGYCFVVK